MRLQEWFEDGTTIGTNASCAVVEWSMSKDNNPGSSSAVDTCEIILQPGKLLIHQTEWSREFRRSLVRSK